VNTQRRQQSARIVPDKGAQVHLSSTRIGCGKVKKPKRRGGKPRPWRGPRSNSPLCALPTAVKRRPARRSSRIGPRVSSDAPLPLPRCVGGKPEISCVGSPPPGPLGRLCSPPCQLPHKGNILVPPRYLWCVSTSLKTSRTLEAIAILGRAGQSLAAAQGAHLTRALFGAPETGAQPEQQPAPTLPPNLGFARKRR